LSGNGGENQQYGAADLAATRGEAFGLPAFAAELLTFNSQVPGTGAPLSSTSPAWLSFAPEVRAALWSQLHSGIISNLQPGESQVSLKLNPPELGQIQLTLNLNGQELTVTAVASRPDVAELATQGVQQLLQSLAQQGLVLTQFQVRLQEHPGVQTSSLLAGNREKNSESGEKFPPPSRRRSSEVDRFV
jgi:flagellar hook-length control protein FliK